MILTRSEFWDRLAVRSADLFAPALAVSSRTAGGQVIRARSFGDDLWTATVTLAPGSHRDIRVRRGLLMLAQQPGVRIVADDPSYAGQSRSGGTLQAVAPDNRTLTLAGMADATLNQGDYIEVSRHFHTVTKSNAPNGSGQMVVEVMPHVRPTIPIGGAVGLSDPGFLAVIDGIRPAMFEAVVAGEVSFTITQVYP